MLDRDDRSDDGGREGAAVLRSMVLLSTLSTAAEVWHAAAERRAGRDPSDQEDLHVATAFVVSARRELEERATGLQASLAYSRFHEEAPSAYLVRHFDHLMTVQRLARVLHLVHQRLLSLYPNVSEEIVEFVRQLQADASAILDDDRNSCRDRPERFVVDVLDLVKRLRNEVG